MKPREKTATGIIDGDGKLRMFMGELNQFFAMHKGCRVVARFTVAPRRSSEALRGYYYNCVVPTFKQAIWDTGERLTEEQAERKLREMSPIMWEQTLEDVSGEYKTRLRGISELDNAELIEHIEHLKQVAAEDYNTYIDDPRTI